MSTLQTTNLKNPSSASNNIVLGTGGDTTVTNNLTVSGTGNHSIAGTLQFNSGYGSAATAYGCRAWVNFNGTTASPSTIRGSGNVSSVTKSGTGVYTVNYTTALPDQSGAPIAFCSDDAVSNRGINMQNTNTVYNLTTSCRLTIWGSGTSVDSSGVYFAIFR